MNVFYEKITPEEAQQLFHCMQQLDKETDFMLYLPEERVYQEKKLAHFIQTTQENGILLGAKVQNQIIGFISAQTSKLAKIKHTGYLVIGVRKKFQKNGIATKLFEELFTWARNRGIRRLELTVITANLPAIKLYEKLGFQKEGLKKEAIYMNNRYYDEFYMAKLFHEKR
ncbi:GNAT family N-acetyltransferase [Listeria valentina]|uniref:GNAT family N-acetyltransferase n=1 Tax=Listeria valentina TaxID=2705293 RepID=UPI001430B6C8|nr:GNAT family N-acetyltransferase [Listeria valentina]